jgi:hypothetical protein
MRVDRAVDKLRGKLVRRGITTTATALTAIVAANAVQAAPASFVTTLSAAAIAGSAVHASTLFAATQTIAMTTLQKAIVTAALAAAVGTGIYAVLQGSQLRGQIRVLQQEQSPLTARLQKLEDERNQATNQLAAVQEENARLKSGQNTAELLRLRGQVGVLRQQAANQAKTQAPSSALDKMMNDPAMKELIRQAQTEKLRSMYADLIKELKLSPEQSDQFLQVMTDMASQALAKYSSTEQGSPGDIDPNTRARLGSQLHELLGDEGLARFKEYSDEIPGRITVSMLNSQLGDNQLNSNQSTRLIQLVKAEPADLMHGITGAPDKVFLGSQPEIDHFLQQIAEANQRIVQQAGGFLTPDQLTSLNSVLTKAIDTRKVQAAALIQKR